MMNRTIAFLFCCSAVTLVSLIGIQASSLQSQERQPISNRTQELVEEPELGDAPAQLHYVNGQPFNAAAKAYQAFQTLKNAKSDDEKADAEDAMREALEAEYEKSLEGYEQNLKAMEEKLKNLQAELKRRRDAKDELVDLKLKTLVNQAQGLSWPGDNSNFPGQNMTPNFNTPQVPHNFPANNNVNPFGNQGQGNGLQNPPWNQPQQNNPQQNFNSQNRNDFGNQLPPTRGK